MAFLDYLIVFAAGLVGETFGALFGGGGFIVQSAQLLVGVPPHLAIANDIASAFFASLFFTFLVRKHGYTNWRVVKWMGPGALVGAVAGGVMLKHMPSEFVSWMVLAICGCGFAYMLYSVVRRRHKDAPHGFEFSRYWPLAAIPASLLCGLYDGVSGAGGGILLISLLVLIFRADAKSLIGTANALSAISLGMAGVTFLFLGLLDAQLMAVLVPANLIAAWLASHIVRKVPEHALRMAFAAVIFVVTVLMAKGQFQAAGL